MNLAKFKQFIRVRLLHADDSPHRIAMGAAVGLFVGCSPAIGLHLLIALLLSMVFRANRAAALCLVWISNPLTFVPIIYNDYIIGKRVMQFIFPERMETSQRAMELFRNLRDQGVRFEIFNADFWKSLLEFLLHGSVELWLGSVVLGICVACAGYLLTYRSVVWYRKYYPRKKISQEQ